MNKWLWAAIAVIVVAAGIYFAYKKPEIAQGEGIKIGVIAPMTGWGAYWGEGYQKGVLLAAEEINAQGGKVTIVVEDGATDAAKSATAAQKLINVDNVGALMVEFTGPTSSVSPIALEKKIPLVYDALVKKFVAENPYAFKFYFDVARQCGIAADQLVKQGAKHIGIFSVNLDFKTECQEELNKVAQGKGVRISLYGFNEDTTDFRTIIAKMKSDAVDAVVPVVYEDHAISFFRQKSELGFMPKIFTGIGIPDGFTEKVRASVPQNAIEGVMTYDQPIAESFKAKLAAKYPASTEKDITPAAYGYDEAMYLYKGMSACASGDTACIVEKMKADTSSGALQSSGFGEDRVLDMNPVYYRYANGALQEFSLK